MKGHGSDHESTHPIARMYASMRVVPLGNVRLAITSGITAGNEAPQDTAAQARIIFDRIGDLLAKEGGGLEHVIKITTFLTDVRDYDQYNSVRGQVFAGMLTPPASATVGVAQLVNPRYRIEVEATAIIPCGTG